MGRRCHPVDVMAAGLLKSEKFPGKLFSGDSLPQTKLADLVILTENAAGVAAGQEDRSRAVPAGDRRFLTMMREYTGDNSGVGHPAVTGLSLQSLDAALTGTDFTGIQVGF